MKNTSSSGRRPCASTCGDRLPDVVRVRLHGLEDRALLQRAAQEHREQRDEDAAQEDQAPSPREQLVRRGSNCTATHTSAPSAVPSAAPTMMSDA